MYQSSRHARSKERGTALIAVVFFAIISMAYISAALTSSLAVRNQARSFTSAERAHQIAESAVHRLIAKLATDESEALLDAGEMNGSVLNKKGGKDKYEVRIWAAADDLADNDQDGNTDEADEADLLEVAATGFYGGQAKTIRVTLLSRYRPSSFGSATYMDDPFATLTLNGNAFKIKGEDHDMVGTPTGTAVVGLGTPGDPSGIAAQIKPKDMGNITGTGGPPSLGQVEALDLQSMIDEGARAADVTLDAGTTEKPAAPGDWGSIGNESIVYSPGDVKIAGGASGVGILIVDGDLEISGTFEWIGIMIVRGGVTFAGGGGGKRLIGSLVVQNRIEDPEAEEIILEGTVDILFSQQAITEVLTSFSSYTILNWREGPVPEIK
ncbi:MAG: hypothetical protein ACYTGZ_13250 [Planctomycetota bacterium]|jgi:hypothetical protein